MSPDHTLTQLLAAEHSKAHTNRIIGWIGRDETRVAALVRVFCSSEYRIGQRAAWVVGDYARRQPDLLGPWLPDLVGQLAQPGTHDAVRRNVVRVLQESELPEELLGEVADACFRMLADPQEPVAIRCFSMSVLERVCQRLPELWPELKLLIEDIAPTGSAGMQSRARRTKPPKGGEPIRF
jgi:hypothetical protein